MIQITNVHGQVVTIRAFVNYWLYNRNITREFGTVAEAIRFIEIRANHDLYGGFKLITGDFMRSYL